MDWCALLVNELIACTGYCCNYNLEDQDAGEKELPLRLLHHPHSPRRCDPLK